MRRSPPVHPRGPDPDRAGVPRRVLGWAVGWAVLVALVGAGGVLARTRGGAWYVLDLDSELAVGAAVSALALVAAGAACLVAARRGAGGRAMAAVGVLLVLMAVDEWFELHESLEEATGVDWQVLYLPVVVAGGACFVLVARRLRPVRWCLLLWIAGAGLWGAAQALEALQWDGDVERYHYGKMMIAEELLELTGTGAFLVAAATAARRRTATPADAPARALPAVRG